MFFSYPIPCRPPSPAIKARKLSPDHWRLCPGIRHGLHGDPKNCPSTKLCSMVSLLKFAQCYRALSQNTSQTIIANAMHFRPNHEDTIIGPYFCISCTYHNHGGKNASEYRDCLVFVNNNNYMPVYWPQTFSLLREALSSRYVCSSYWKRIRDGVNLVAQTSGSNVACM